MMIRLAGRDDAFGALLFALTESYASTTNVKCLLFPLPRVSTILPHRKAFQKISLALSTEIFPRELRKLALNAGLR
jgi:hypothetical protein